LLLQQEGPGSRIGPGAGVLRCPVQSKSNSTRARAISSDIGRSVPLLNRANV
jgi:hypothetical protein